MNIEFKPQEVEPEPTPKPAENILVNGEVVGRLERGTHCPDNYVACIHVPSKDKGILLGGYGVSKDPQAAVEEALDELRGHARTIQDFIQKVSA